MRTTRVLLIESARNNGRTFSTSLQRKYSVEIAHSGKQGLTLAREKHPHVIILDADSLRTSGDRIASRLRDQLGEMPIIHIKPEGAGRDQSTADIILCLPFTSRKLSNRIEQYAAAPEEGQIREVGPFTLNLETQTLTTPWKEKKLTPKLLALMDLFLQNPAQTLERKQIMQRVWKTDYVADTRTLDVHIRWLRQVTEPDPRNPKYLMTERGVGYRFAIPKMDDAIAETAGVSPAQPDSGDTEPAQSQMANPEKPAARPKRKSKAATNNGTAQTASEEPSVSLVETS